MNWSKMKNTMIVFLLVVNVILLGVLYGVETDHTTLSKEEVDNGVQVLKNHGITIDASMVPTRGESLGNLPMVTATENQEQFVSTFLGTSYEHQKEQETGTNVYTAGAKTVRLNGGYVKYYSGREQNGEPSDATWENVRKTLEVSGLSLSDAVEVKKGKNECRFHQQYKGKEFFEGHLIVIADQEGIVSVEGFWMIPGGSAFGQEQVGKVTEVFSDFIKDPSRASESNQIVDITLGYSVLLGEAGVNYSEATAIPVWRFSTADGKVYYYDARKN